MIQVQAVVHMSKEAGMRLECNRLEREDASDAERAVADAIESMHVLAMKSIVSEINKAEQGVAEFTRLLRPDEIDAAAVRVRCEAAMQMVSDLCDGKRVWTVSVTGDFDYDPDAVISAALADIPKLLEALGE